MVWVYVVIGLVVIIAILILMKSDRTIKGRFVRRAKVLADVTYVCMHCGHSFKGAKCPKCGFDRKPVEFGR